MKKIFFVLTLLSSLYCIAQDNAIISQNIIVIEKQEKKFPDSILKVWQHKDIFLDGIQGVSTEKAYTEILSKIPGGTVVVAVIDGGTDIDHEDLKDQIWINTKEIPDNGKDDDNNGYIDDIHGWNFLGNHKGENAYYARWEFVKLLKNKGYLSKKGLRIPDYENDSVILEAVKHYKNAKNTLKEDKAYVAEHKLAFQEIKKALQDYFPNQNYTLEKLKTIDTIKKVYLKTPVKTLHSFLSYDLTEAWLDDYEKSYVTIIANYKLNPDYNERKRIGDDFKDTNYGNNVVIKDKAIDTHGTAVAGMIGATRNNNIGIDGIVDNARLMILRVVPQGDEYDKDVALAIRYAVDNGAKVINMSFGKFFSSHPEMVTKAIEYANDKDVLIVHAAGNDSKNIDTYNFYPLDYSNNKEVSQSFISVGALNTFLDHRLPAYFSNYGKKNVDVFAPGKDLYTTAVNNEYSSADGTSVAAPIVSGIAALIRSRYPKLTAIEVKDIILESGNVYHINVRPPGDVKGPRIPFSELSKSGKVVNAYNALLLAEQVSKGKH